MNTGDLLQQVRSVFYDEFGAFRVCVKDSDSVEEVMPLYFTCAMVKPVAFYWGWETSHLLIGIPSPITWK